MLIQAKDRTGSNQQVNYDKRPDYCPICCFSISPIETNLQFVTIGTSLEIVFRCPREACERFFIARYTFRRNKFKEFYSFAEAVPLTIKAKNFSKCIKDISQNFENIYQEAEKAELQGLKLVCGPGYRKALEFLIKDYVIAIHPDKEMQIKKTFLGKCISRYVNEGDVKEVAKRAAWLGNDETHYLRIWKDKDIEDLKRLINLTVHWIEIKKGAEEAKADMPEGKQSPQPEKPEE